MGSLILAFFVSGRLYQDQLDTLVQDNMISSGKAIIQSYEQSDPGNLDALVRGMKVLSLYTIQIYNGEGKPLHESEQSGHLRIQLNEDQIRHVLQGGVYRRGSSHGANIVVGLPFEVNGRPYALFIAPSLGEILEVFATAIRTQLLIVLLFGSLLILLAARYIVRPLQLLTRAARRMAKGNFRIDLKTKRKDEIGQLTASFNEMAKELGMLEQIRQRFVSDVSHEIQSPLTSIKGFTQALKHKKMDEESRMHLLTIIEEESDRLSRLSEDLLQLSSLEYAHLELHPRRYRLDEQLRKVVIAYEPQWAAKHLHVDLDMTAIFITADEDRLMQLWNNLLSNAIKFTDRGGSIRIGAIDRGDRVEVAVADSGQGIPEDERNRIFEPFYKVDKSRERKVGGSGLGLSIVKRIVDLHHGEIRVSSRLGEGTTFTVTLPANLQGPNL
ncbi:HAMP domain-containing protein [Cohnella sp. CFH 77786]|nr:HAMP domain-containing sensor histidine kinase [Cohnella sp. CFH 77786]MBW5446954.1 HAMP domain-containing protein [Cohnella sp. CFH 77786]